MTNNDLVLLLESLRLVLLSSSPNDINFSSSLTPGSFDHDSEPDYFSLLDTSCQLNRFKSTYPGYYPTFSKKHSFLSLLTSSTPSPHPPQSSSFWTSSSLSTILHPCCPPPRTTTSISRERVNTIWYQD